MRNGHAWKTGVWSLSGGARSPKKSLSKINTLPEKWILFHIRVYLKRKFHSNGVIKKVSIAIRFNNNILMRSYGGLAVAFLIPFYLSACPDSEISVRAKWIDHFQARKSFRLNLQIADIR